MEEKTKALITCIYGYIYTFSDFFNYRLLQDILLHSRSSFIYFINSHVYLLSPNS